MKANQVSTMWLHKPLLFCLLSIFTGNLHAQQSAAQIDWVPAAALSSKPGCQSLLEPLPHTCRAPLLCSGRYVEPDWQHPASDDEEGSDPIRASGESADRDSEGNIILVGDVEIQQGHRTIRTQHATLNQSEDRVWVEGDVLIRESGLLMTGARGYSILSTGEGGLENSTFLLHEGRLRGQAERLTRTTDNHILILDGLFTRCEPDSNVWEIRGRKMELDPMAGFGTARDLTLRIKDIPIAYTPYFRFPIDDQRHSGFLMPSLSHDNDGGTDISAPYYFNLAPNYDATYIPRSIWKRGLLNEVQLRLMTAASTNDVNAAYLHEDDIFDDRSLVYQTGSESGFLQEFEPQSRWFLNVRHTGGWSRRLKTTLRYSAVSDLDYLDDIGGDVDSVAVEQFYGGIDQSIGSSRTAALDRKADVIYRGEGWNAGVRLQAFQNLDVDRTENYEQLPRVHFEYSGGNKLQYKLATEYVYFEKDNEDLAGTAKVIGGRTAIDATVSLPLRRQWGFLKPTVSVKHREYDLEDTTPFMEARPDITVPVFSLDGGLFFDRFFSLADRDLQQTLEPRLYFLYAKEVDQGNLPRFDATELTRGYSLLFRDGRFAGKDRVGDARQLSAGITTRFFDQGSGIQYLNFSIGQIYYFKDREVFLPPDLPGVDRGAPYSPLFGQLTVSPNKAIRATASLEWEPRNGRTGRGHVSLRYSPDYMHILNISYRYTNKDVHSVTSFENIEASDITVIWPIKGKLSAIGRWNFGWDNDQTIESFAGIEYNDCCWRTRLVFRRFLKDPRALTLFEEDPASPGGVRQVSFVDHRADTGVFFEFQLKGLATMGRRLDSLLDDAIIGYREREDYLEN